MRGILCAIALCACGPVAYVGNVTFHADGEIQKARELHADKFSPYYWTRANQYLHMARDVAAHADFQGANRFGRLAAEAAVKAQEEAELGAKDPSKLPYIDLDKDTQPKSPGKDVAPAKDGGGVAPAKDDR
jgi:hypothetical protein